MSEFNSGYDRLFKPQAKVMGCDAVSYAFYYLRLNDKNTHSQPAPEKQAEMQDKLAALKAKLGEQGAAIVETWAEAVIRGEHIPAQNFLDSLELADLIIRPTEPTESIDRTQVQARERKSETYPRNALMQDLLGRLQIRYDLKINTIEQLRDAKMSRPEPYFSYLIPDKKMVVEVCDAHGFITIIFYQVDNPQEAWRVLAETPIEQIKERVGKDAELLVWTDGLTWAQQMEARLQTNEAHRPTWTSHTSLAKRLGVDRETLSACAATLIAEQPEHAAFVKKYSLKRGNKTQEFIEYEESIIPSLVDVIKKRLEVPAGYQPLTDVVIDFLKKLGGAQALGVGEEEAQIAMANYLRILTKREAAKRASDANEAQDRITRSNVIYLKDDFVTKLENKTINKKRNDLARPLVPPELGTNTVNTVAAIIIEENGLKKEDREPLVQALVNYFQHHVKPNVSEYDSATKQGDYGLFRPSLLDEPHTFFSGAVADWMVKDFTARIRTNRLLPEIKPEDKTLMGCVDAYRANHANVRISRSSLCKLGDSIVNASDGKQLFAIDNTSVKYGIAVPWYEEKATYFTPQKQAAFLALLDSEVKFREAIPTRQEGDISRIELAKKLHGLLKANGVVRSSDALEQFILRDYDRLVAEGAQTDGCGDKRRKPEEIDYSFCFSGSIAQKLIERAQAFYAAPYRGRKSRDS